MIHHFTTTETTTATPNIISTAVSIQIWQWVMQYQWSQLLLLQHAIAGYAAQQFILMVYHCQTEKWNGGTAPSAGGSSGNDFYLCLYY